jgi:hypothetical protein
MERRGTVVALAALVAVASAGCRTDEVRLGFEPPPRATYRYRYEVDATVTRAIDGEEPRTTSVHLTLESRQTVLERTPEGTRMEVTLTAPQSAPRTAEVVVDRAGSLQAIQHVEGLPAESVGLPSATSLLAATSVPPPSGPLALGDSWDVTLGVVSGESRLDHFAIVDGTRAAVVASDLVEVLTDTVRSGGNDVVLDGDLRSSSTTAFDLGDGSVRRGRTHSRGTVDVLVSPPVDVVAPPVDGVVTYELRVTTTRID